MKRCNRGQVTVETAVLFSAVIGALLFLVVYVQRAAQGGIKGNADSLGSQLSINTPWSSVSHQMSLSDQAASETTSCSQTQQKLGSGTGGGGIAPPAQDCTPNTPNTHVAFQNSGPGGAPQGWQTP